MLTIKQITDNTEGVIRGLEKKHFKDAKATIEQVLAFNDKRRNTQNQLDKNLAEVNSISKSIGLLMKEGKKEEAETAKARVAEIKEISKTLQAEMDQAQEDMNNLLYTIPNVPYDEVPEGFGAEDNVVEKMGGMETELPKDALPHWELAKKYDLIDFDLGVKITGAGFPVYKGKGARLQRALINFFLDEARASGYDEIMPPTVVNTASGYGTGQLPDKEGQMYHCEVDDLYLIPTAEVPVTNIYRDVILEEKQLPIKNCAYTQCFRREAGSYGKDVRGLNRLHEFSKVELVRIDKPEHSKQSHQEMLNHVEGLLQKLELPYRILRLCGGGAGLPDSIRQPLSPPPAQAGAGHLSAAGPEPGAGVPAALPGDRTDRPRLPGCRAGSGRTGQLRHVRPHPVPVRDGCIRPAGPELLPQGGR